MERPNYVVKVDMVDTGIVESGIRLKQGDCGAVIYLKIYNDGNVYYDADLLPEVYFKRADGSTVIGKTAVGYDDMYAYTIIGNELKVAGTVIMDVKFKLEGGRESSASCSFECVADTIGETIEQSNIYWNDVVKVLSELERVSKEAETLTTNLSEIVSQIILNAEDSDSHAVESRSYAIGGTGTREREDADNAKYYCEQSGNYFASVLENVSLVEEATRNAIEAEQNAVYSENEAALSKEGAAGSAILARSYAVGGTGTREGEDADNAKYYYEQTREHGTDIAAVDRVGIIKPDGDTISIQEDGTIKAEKAEKDGNGNIISETYVIATDLDALESELSAAVSNAQATAQSAKTDAANAKTTASGAKSTADSALSKANSATTKANQASQAASGAVTTANNAFNYAETASSTVGQLNQYISFIPNMQHLPTILQWAKQCNGLAIGMMVTPYAPADGPQTAVSGVAEWTILILGQPGSVTRQEVIAFGFGSGVYATMKRSIFSGNWMGGWVTVR